MGVFLAKAEGTSPHHVATGSPGDSEGDHAAQFVSARLGLAA